MRFLVALIVLGALAGIGYVLRWAVDVYDQLKRDLASERRRRASDIEFLNGFTRKLADVAEVADAMDMVAHHVLHVLQAESVGIYIMEEARTGKQLRGIACTGTFPAFGQEQTVIDLMLRIPKRRPAHFGQETIALGDGLLGDTAQTGTTRLVTDDEDLSDYGFPRHVACLIATPMKVEETITGLVVAVNCRDERRRLAQRDAELLAALSCQAALASNLIQVYSERSRQEQLVQEMRIGRELQRSLLPDTEPDFGLYRFAVYGEAAMEVAGDYYDFVPIGDDRMVILVADATGKGVSACMLMAMCRSFAHAAAENYVDMASFLGEMNRQLFADTDPSHFITLGAVMLDRRNQTFDYGCAGHTPLLLRNRDSGPTVLKTNGPALGILPPDMGVTFQTKTVPCPPGTQLLLFSDGIVEAINEQDDEFGMDRLLGLWRNHPLPPHEMVELITDRVETFAGETPQSDDQTMVLIEAAD